MRLIFMGTPDFAVTALKALAPHHEIAAVYAQPPRPAGRGQQPRLGPVHRFAQQQGFPVLTPSTLRKPETQAEFEALKADVAVVAAYGLILPRQILAMPKHGCLNIHASLLPRWRGAAPIQRAIMAGDAVSGVTIMQMDAGLDTGPMLTRREVPITMRTTAQELHDQLAEAGAALIVETLRQLAAGTVQATPQPSDGVTHAAKIDKAETRIDFKRPADAVVRHIHALSPSPGAWFEASGERIKVLRAVAVDGTAAPGEVLDDGLTIACGEGAVQLLQVQRAGRAAVDAASFLRGFRLPAGTLLA